MYSVKYASQLHYELISVWWKQHKWPVIPEDHLPKTGFVVYFEEEPVIAGFLYKTDSSFGLFEFIVANPQITGLKRDLAFDKLTESVLQYSLEMGIKTLFSSVTNKNLIAKLVKNGFIVTDTDMTNLVRRV